MHGGLVVGIEGAISWPGNGFGSESCLANVGAGITCESRTNFLATIGGRLGWGFSNFLIYGSGGFAHGQIDTQIAVGGVPINTPPLGFSTRGGHDGWYLGAGLEYAITRNIIIGVEYQHITLNNNLDRANVTLFPGIPGVLGAPAPGANIFDRDIHADYDIVRARLSYKFYNEERARPLK
jgi:outer membrane immunogenic protein